MPTIASPGLGSKLDVNSIVEQLVALERRPIDRLEVAAQTIQTKLSSFGLLQNYLTNLKDAAERLSGPKLWAQTAATSSDATSVSATSGADTAPGSYLVEVSQLAQAQSLSSKAYAASTAVVGSGTLHLDFGSWNADQSAFTASAKPSLDIVIAPGQDSLAAIRDTLNAAKAGVSASIVNDAAGARLVIRSTATGEANALRIRVSDDDGTPGDAAGLSALAFDPPVAGGRMTQDLVARNATAKVNGLAISSPSNTLDGVVDGVTMTLSKLTTAPVEVRVARSTDVMTKSVNDFVKAYNDINAYIAEQTKYDPDTKVAGKLQGDSSTLAVQRQLRQALQTVSTASSTFNRLSALGLQMQRDGSLKVDGTALSNALTGNLDEVAQAFGRDDAGGRGYAVVLGGLAKQLIATDGAVTTRSQGLRDSIRRNEKEQDRLEERVAATRERLLRQYGSLDTKMSQLSSLSDYVTQQMTMLTKSLRSDR